MHLRGDRDGDDVELLARVAAESQDVGFARDVSFVGRLAERSVLDACLRDAQSGHPQVVLIEGPAGIGKSALVREFLRELPAAALFMADADQSELDLSYAVAQQLLETPDGPHPSAAGAPDPLAVGAALRESFSTHRAGGCTVVAVEDIHWADAASLQALTFALRRLARVPVLCIVTLRPEGAGRVPHGLRQLAAHDGASITLGGLDARELQQLGAECGREIGPQVAERLREHTAGNPLYVQAILDEVNAEALLDGGRGPIPAPSSFGAVVLAKLAACSAACEELVAAAAVAGDATSIDDVLRLANLESAFPAADEAVAARLLEIVTTSNEDRVRFVHPLVRCAVYHHLSPGRRARLHDAAAAASDDPRIALRHRVAGAYGVDDDLAAAVERSAQEDSARGAWTAACASYLSASRLSSDRATTENRFLCAVGSAIAAGDLTEARRLHEQTAGFAESVLRKYIAGTLAGVELRTFDARRLLEQAWSERDASTPAGLAVRIASRLAGEYLTTGQATRAAVWSRRALRLSADAQVAGDDPVTLHLMTLAGAGKFNEATALLATHPELVVVEPGRWPSGLLGRGALKLWTDDVAGAREDLSRVLEAPEWSGPTSMRLLAMLFLAEAEYRAGAWDEALNRAQLVRSIATDGQLLDIAAMATAVLALPHAARGDAQETDALVSATFQSLPEGGVSPAAGRALYARGLAAHSIGDYAGAAETLSMISSVAHAPGLSEATVLPWSELLAVGLVQTGRLEEAALEVKLLERAAEVRRLPSARFGALRARALLQAARGDTDSAAATFAAAEEVAAALALPFPRALLDLDHGAFLRRTGQRKQAAARLEAARDTFALLKAPTYAGRAETELAACDVGTRQRETAPTVLTPAEQSVAELIAGGSSNRDAANALALSVRTVETHLVRIYRKLGVNSRAQLAAQFGAARVAASALGPAT